MSELKAGGYDTYKGLAYRYMSFEGLFATIQTGKLRFSRSDQMNDPLDMIPYLYPFKWKEIFESGEGLEFSEAFRHHVYKKVVYSIYICCFSKHYFEKKSFLMWSHYGDHHRGVCFEIDFSKHEFLGGPEEVSYPKDLVIQREKMKDVDAARRGRFLATSKMEVWEYEKEVRLIVDTLPESLDFDVVQFDEGCKHLTLPFDLNLISKVIFGANSEKVNRIKTMSLLRERGVNPEFETMKIDPRTLEFDKENIENSQNF